MDHDTLKLLSVFLQSLSGTAEYMTEKRADLFAMLGSPNMTVDIPTFFHTLSSGDLYWPQLYRMIDPCFDAYEEAAANQLLNPHSRFDVTEWLPLVE